MSQTNELTYPERVREQLINERLGELEIIQGSPANYAQIQAVEYSITPAFVEDHENQADFNLAY